MPQFYLLSVVSTVVAGLALSSDYLGKKSDFFASFRYLRQKRSIQITTGLITAVIGVLKLIFRSPGENVVVVGDLLPAAAGIILGIILIGEAFRQHPSEEAEQEKVGKSVEKMTQAIMPYRVPVGIAGAVIGLLHFLFPQILFL
jgi:drug/metabolite transporter (DMT)-like permease